MCPISPIGPISPINLPCSWAVLAAAARPKSAYGYPQSMVDPFPLASLYYYTQLQPLPQQEREAP